jgi:hypothetical protein
VNDKVSSREIVKGILDYINTHIVAMVGTPVYTCPKCRKTNEEKNNPRPFKEIVPMNVSSVFFELLTLKMKQNQKENELIY